MNKTTVVIFFVILSVSFNSYSFWIWSPKTKSWKNPKNSALATPYIQYREAMKFFDKKDYDTAYKEFKKILIHYPDSQEAADAQYFMGFCLEELNQPYKAFLEYQKVLDSYPNSKRINEVVKRQYEIGENFLTKSSKGWLGVTVYDFVNHPSIEIFKKIVDKVPYSPYASSAQYKLGVLYVKLGRFDDAVDEFQKVIDNYPDTEWAAPARYQLAIATSKSSYGNQYDSTALDEARKRLEEFIELHPDADISLDASKQLDSMRQREAAKNFETAEFYEKQLKFEAAILYYQIVVSDYKDSLLFDSSSKSISEINFLLKQGLSPKEIFRRRKKSLVESNVLKEKVKELK